MCACVNNHLVLHKGGMAGLVGTAGLLLTIPKQNCYVVVSSNNIVAIELAAKALRKCFLGLFVLV